MADNLHKAKNEKFDEFYTEFSDIQKEINAYLEYNPEVFKNKIVLFLKTSGLYSRYALTSLCISTNCV